MNRFPGFLLVALVGCAETPPEEATTGRTPAAEPAPPSSQSSVRTRVRAVVAARHSDAMAHLPKTPEVAAELRWHARNASHLGFRARALAALGFDQSAETRTLLLEMLEPTVHPSLRSSAVKALADWPRPLDTELAAAVTLACSDDDGRIEAACTGHAADDRR